MTERRFTPSRVPVATGPFRCARQNDFDVANDGPRHVMRWRLVQQRRTGATSVATVAGECSKPPLAHCTYRPLVIERRQAFEANGTVICLRGDRYSHLDPFKKIMQSVAAAVRFVSTTRSPPTTQPSENFGEATLAETGWRQGANVDGIEVREPAAACVRDPTSVRTAALESGQAAKLVGYCRCVVFLQIPRHQARSAMPRAELAQA